MYAVYDKARPDEVVYVATLEEVHDAIERGRKLFAQEYGWKYVSIYDNRVSWSRRATYEIRTWWPFVALAVLTGALLALV